MSNGPNLWWVYEEDSRSFSTLPAGPFLIPALLIASFISLFGIGRPKRVSFEKIAGDLANSEEWQNRHRRYIELTQKRVNNNNNLELNERHELSVLQDYLYSPHNH